MTPGHAFAECRDTMLRCPGQPALTLPCVCLIGINSSYMPSKLTVVLVHSSAQ